jgi:cell division initiation protein
MPLSPIDVQQQTFKVALRGYAEDEVDEFLDEVVIALRDYEQRLRDAQERVAVLEEQLSANRETEDAMRRTFLVAQRTADTIVEEAKAESERMVSGARGEVERVAAEQTEERAQLLSETALLRDRVHGLRASLKDLAGRTLDRLDALEVDAAADRISALAAPAVEPIVHPDPEPEVVEYVSDEPIDATEDQIELAEESADETDFDDAIDLGDFDQEGDDARQDEPEVVPAGDYPAAADFSDGEEAEDADGSDDGDDDDFSDDDTSDDDEFDAGGGDEGDIEDDVEIAKVPDWMTRDDSTVEESIEDDSRPAYRRPWERDED